MSPKWIIFLVTLWMFGAFFGLFLEGTFPGGEEETVINTLISSKALTATSWMGKITGAITDLDVWLALGKIFIWDYSFWDGSFLFIPLEPVRWCLFLPISAGILFSILTAWIRGVGGT